MGTNKKWREANRKQLFVILIVLVAACFGVIRYSRYLSEASLRKVTFRSDGGELKGTFKLEVANTQKDRSLGLMFRKELKPDRGMLFVFPKTDNRTFWMKDTLIALDILFLDASLKVVGILKNVPILNEKKRGVSQPSKYVVELNAGTVDQSGIKVGDTMILDSSLSLPAGT